jgi:2-polyprenyl-3-methyl-5-hydroxy-6-metoxy-1,4-benzoquinol methylase
MMEHSVSYRSLLQRFWQKPPKAKIIAAIERLGLARLYASIMHIFKELWQKLEAKIFTISEMVPFKLVLKNSDAPLRLFNAYFYLRHNQRRQEHLASLRLDILNSSVLEVGAGVGDHTSFFLDRGCKVVSTECRETNLTLLRQRYPNIEVKKLDLDNPDRNMTEVFDIVYCYGVLYHLKNPAEAIQFMSQRCRNMLLLETCISFGDGEEVNPCSESPKDPTQSVYGIGCRPTRKWVYNQLKLSFEHVYMPVTQPYHEEFPLDWTSREGHSILTRSVYIASRTNINNDLLIEGIPLRQIRH